MFQENKLEYLTLTYFYWLVVSKERAYSSWASYSVQLFRYDPDSTEFKKFATANTLAYYTEVSLIKENSFSDFNSEHYWWR